MYTLVKLDKTDSDSGHLPYLKPVLDYAASKYRYVIYHGAIIMLDGEGIVITDSKERLMVELIKQLKRDGADYIAAARTLFTSIYDNEWV